jgi:O-antigen ligase
MHAPTQWWGASLPDIRWSLIAALVTGVSLLIHRPKEGFSFFSFAENKLMFALLVLVSIQYLWVSHPELHIEYVFLLAKFVALMFLMQNIVKTAEDIKVIIFANIIGTAFLSYYGMSTTSGGRMESIGNGWDSNLVGMHLSAMVVLGGYFLLDKFRPSHIVLVIAMGVILMGLFMTESRGALIALASTGVLAILFRPSSKRKKFYVFCFSGAFAASILMGPQILERFDGMNKDNVGEIKDRSAESRLVIIKAQFEMWSDSLITGHGHRGTLFLSPQYISQEFTTTGGLRASHNVAMSFLVDHGIIGFFLYFSVIFLCARRIFDYKTIEAPSHEDSFYSNALLGSILALYCFMAGGMFSNNKKVETDILLIALIPILHRHVVKSRTISLSTQTLTPAK